MTSKLMIVLALNACAITCPHSVVAQVTFTNLGVVPSGTWSKSYGVNADGSVVVGSVLVSIPGSGGNRGFRWTAQTGMQSVGVLPGGGSDTYGVNATGDMVVGVSAGRAFRWTPTGGMQSLGFLPGGNNSWGTGVNAVGTTVVGHSLAPSEPHAFRWTAQLGMVDLGTFPGESRSWAQAISADGSVVIGYAELAGRNRAVAWTGMGIQDLGVLSTGDFSSATAVNDDGSVIVGWGSGAGAPPYQAFRWTTVGGMQNIGMTAGAKSCRALGVSGDGAIVVGTDTNGAFIWSTSQGITGLYAYLTSQGVNLAGWSLAEATAVCTDGSAIVGWGDFNGQTRAWLVTGIPAPEPLCFANCDRSTTAPILNVNDFACFLNLYAAADPGANCDGTTVPPVLNVNDFACFLNRFAAGCP
ncbi:MAG: GC-type dockerin domain-anchored protein [Phycisphaerales bacterium]